MNEDETARPPTILVVDDNEANRALAQATLEDEGYRVVLAAGGAAGIAAFQNARPDCVLLDVRMPEIDGFDFVRVVRHRFPRIPLALMTAYPTDNEDIPQGVPVLVKPFEIEQLMALLSSERPPSGHHA